MIKMPTFSSRVIMCVGFFSFSLALLFSFCVVWWVASDTMIVATSFVFAFAFVCVLYSCRVVHTWINSVFFFIRLSFAILSLSTDKLTNETKRHYNTKDDQRHKNYKKIGEIFLKSKKKHTHSTLQNYY